MKSIERYSSYDLIEELESRSRRMYDLVDNGLLDEITSVFDSLNCFDREKLRDLVVNFGKK